MKLKKAKSKSHHIGFNLAQRVVVLPADLAKASNARIGQVNFKLAFGCIHLANL